VQQQGFGEAARRHPPHIFSAMADPSAPAPGSLGDFFAKKKKKNIKGSNLNNEAANPKAEEKKKPTKEKEEEGWEEEQIAVPTMKVEVAGKLTRDDDKKEEEDTVAPAWRTSKSGDGGRHDLNEKRYPTLAKAVGRSSNINIDDGSAPTVNIKTTKNAFAALHDHDDDEDEGPKRPKEIKPAMVQKQKGERTSAAIQREVDKYGGPVEEKKEKKTKKKKKQEIESSEDEDEDADEVEDKKKKKKDDKKKGAPKDDEEDEEAEVMEDVKMQPDLEASRKKYQGRKKLPKVDIPVSELEEEKENRPKAQPAAGGKKGKKKFVEEEYEKPKLLVADWD